jgi:hypothetical protein
MNAIKILRDQAAKKRDDAIKAARDEYHDTIRHIDELGQRLFHVAPVRRGKERQRRIVDLIVEMMPKDRPFSIREVLASIREAEPKRQFHEPTIRTLFKRLIDQGVVRKVRKGDRGFILWAAAECPIEDHGPLASVSIADAVEYVLHERGPLRPVEVVLAVQEFGYRPDADKRALLGTLAQAYKRNKHRFAIGDDGKWSTV